VDGRFLPENPTSNGKVFNIKVVGNFLLMLIDIKFVQNGEGKMP
jgi:hypothetical protein